MEYVGGILRKLPSDSSDSNIHQLLFPSFAEFPNEFKTPPLITVGSIFACEKILDINEVVVVFPWEPETIIFFFSVFIILLILFFLPAIDPFIPSVDKIIVPLILFLEISNG